MHHIIAYVNINTNTIATGKEAGMHYNSYNIKNPNMHQQQNLDLCLYLWIQKRTEPNELIITSRPFLKNGGRYCFGVRRRIRRLRRCFALYLGCY